MRVLILTPDIYTRGGIARYTATLASALGTLAGPENVDVLPLLGTAGAGESRWGYRILNPVTCRLSTASKLRFASRSLGLGWHRYDLVISTHIGLSPVAALIHLFYGTPFWVTCHGREAWPRFPADVRWAMRMAGHVVPVSQFTADRVAKVNGVPRSRMSVLYNAIPEDFVELLTSPNCDDGARVTSKRKEKCILSVGTVSRESAYKGYDTVIQALPRVVGAVPGVRYVLVGDGDDIDRLKRLALQVGVGHLIEFKGGIPDADLARRYRDCDVFALPSRAVSPNGKAWQGEGFGRVYVEASLARKPVVGSTGGGAAEAVLHRKTGLLVNPESVDEIADALIELLLNPEEATMMGRAGQRWALENFTLGALKGRLAKLLDSCGFTVHSALPERDEKRQAILNPRTMTQARGQIPRP